MEGGSWQKVGMSEGGGRKSKDTKINKEERMLVRFIEEKGCMVLNEGEGRRSRRVHIYKREEGTVIDLMLEDSEVKERIEGFRGGIEWS